MRKEEEKIECLALVEWMTLKGLIFSHIPQETFTKSWGVKMKNKIMGVKPGVPDYLIIIPKIKSKTDKSQLVFIEMKKKKGGITNINQLFWIEQLNCCEGIMARVCNGTEEAIKFLNHFIK